MIGVERKKIKHNCQSKTNLECLHCINKIKRIIPKTSFLKRFFTLLPPSSGYLKKFFRTEKAREYANCPNFTPDM